MNETDLMQLFMLRVHEMRALQKRYFAGEHSLLHDAKKAEKVVDIALATLCSKFGFSMQDIEKKYIQRKFF